MVARGFFDHVVARGHDPRERVRAAGYRGGPAHAGRRDDLLGRRRGRSTPLAIVRMWLPPPSHRAIVLRPGLPRGRHRRGAGARGTGDGGATVAAAFGAARR